MNGQDGNAIFWDNDSLAALLALEVKSDLLILLVDEEGLRANRPSEAESELIHTYIEDKHADVVNCGPKTMVASKESLDTKVYAAQTLANAGVPVIIAR
jgi:delta-1-pyrroline-5-carboxylate synthetase